MAECRVRGLFYRPPERTEFLGIEVHVRDLRPGDIIWGTRWREMVGPDKYVEYWAEVDHIEKSGDEDGEYFTIYYSDDHMPNRLKGDWARVRLTKTERGVVYPRRCLISLEDRNNEKDEFLRLESNG